MSGWGKEWDNVNLEEIPANSEESTPKDTKKPNQIAQLMDEVLPEVEVFPANLGGTYVRLEFNGHHEIWQLGSSQFSSYLTTAYYEATGSLPTQAAIKGCIALLEHKAYSLPPQILYIRVGQYGDKYYLDLCNEKFQVVEISREGRKIIEDSLCPCYFIRPDTALPLPEPTTGDGENPLKLLLDFFHFVKNDAVMTYCWLLNTLTVGSPYPILLVSAEHGAGKSVTSRLLTSIIDPHYAPLISLTKDEKSLFATTGGRHILAFDNLSGMTADQSDMLCRVATGGGISSRKLYTDGEAVVFTAQRPMLMNGISPGISRPDLLDRCYPVTLKALSPSDRRTENELLSTFDIIRPKLLGALLDSLVGSLQQVDYKPTLFTRMADAAATVLRAEEAGAVPWEPGTFAKIMSLKEDEKQSDAIELNPLVSRIIQLLNEKVICQATWKRWDNWVLERAESIEGAKAFFEEYTYALSSGHILPRWIGTTANLLEWLQKRSDGAEKFRLPSAPTLGKDLVRLKPVLEHAGVTTFKVRYKAGTLWVLYKPLSSDE